MWLLLLIILLASLVIRLWKLYRYWTNKGVSQVRPLPIVGNLGPLVFRTSSSAEIIEDSYNAFPDKRYYGVYEFFHPTLVVRCPDLIKAVTIREFDTFPEHRLTLTPDIDPLFSNNLFSIRDRQRWQELRSILTPFFTTVKLRNLFGLVHKCAEQCMDYIENQEAGLIFETNDFFNKYANDVIGSTAFGVTCNSFQNPDNEFFLMGKDSTIITPWKSFKLFLHSLSPFLMKIFKVRIIPKQADLFFRSITTKSINLRQQQEIFRPDLLNLLMEARKLKPDMVLTDEDITANAFIFFLAGLDTTSRALSFTFYELAINPTIQKRLQDEIDDVLKTGDVTYDKLNEMKYLDMVISEALRMWPPIIFSERRSVKPFVIEAKNPGEKRLHLDSYTDIWIPIYALQRDPKYFPQPDIFDPERFGDANKHKINPFTYLPFGTGPRNCIGLRFALMEMKMITFSILSKYNIVPTERTPIPLVLGRGQLFPSAEGGIYVKVMAREKYPSKP